MSEVIGYICVRGQRLHLCMRSNITSVSEVKGYNCVGGHRLHVYEVKCHICVYGKRSQLCLRSSNVGYICVCMRSKITAVSVAKDSICVSDQRSHLRGVKVNSVSEVKSHVCVLRNIQRLK